MSIAARRTIVVLQSNMDAVTSTLSEMFASSFRKSFGDFQLYEVEIALEVSADGKIGIMGSGLDVEGGASIRLRFVSAPGNGRRIFRERRYETVNSVLSPCSKR